MKKGKSSKKDLKQFPLLSRFQQLAKPIQARIVFGLVSGLGAIVAVALVLGSSPQPIIKLAATGQGDTNRSSMGTEDSIDKSISGDYLTYEYKAGPELSNEAGSGQVYKLVRTGDPEAVLASLARVFSVEGSVKKYPDFSDQNPGYFFSNSDDPWGIDNQNPMLSLWWGGTGSWNYSKPGEDGTSSSSCEPDSEGNCQEWTEAVPTPELLPTREDAIAKALEIFRATGLSVTEADLKVDYSEWGVYISAAMSVAGQPTSIEWYIGWSSIGEISFAGGHTVTAESVGTFDTISAVQAVDRIADWRWFGSAATSFYEKYQGGFSGASDRNQEAIEPDFGDSNERSEQEIQTLTIITAESTLVSIWDAAGDVWLVPGFVLVNDQGWWNSVISVVEGVIALPEPTVIGIDPLPADDSPVGN